MGPLRGVRVLMVTSAPERFEAVRARVAALDPEGQAADRLVPGAPRRRAEGR